MQLTIIEKFAVKSWRNKPKFILYSTNQLTILTWHPKAVMKSIAVVVFLMLAKAVAGQPPAQLVVPAGSIISEVLTPDKIYQHPQFVVGKVLYRNGTETEARLNYNYLSGNIEFISPGNDTLVIARELVEKIKNITINGHTYIYQEVYFEQVAESAFGKLLKRQVYLIANREKMGAYNQYTSLSTIYSMGNLTDRFGGFSRNLKVDERITMAFHADYFFSDKKENILPANRKNITRSYPSKRPQVENYLQQHKVDFKNGEDLKNLFSSL